MAAPITLDALQALVRRLMAEHGGSAVQEALTAACTSTPGEAALVPAPPPTPRARRSRPPERYSPDGVQGERRTIGSPRRDPPERGRYVPASPPAPDSGRNPRHQRDSRGSGRAGPSTSRAAGTRARPPPSSLASAPPDSVPGSGGEPRSAAVTGLRSRAAGAGSSPSERRESEAGQRGGCGGVSAGPVTRRRQRGASSSVGGAGTAGAGSSAQASAPVRSGEPAAAVRAVRTRARPSPTPRATVQREQQPPCRGRSRTAPLHRREAEPAGPAADSRDASPGGRRSQRGSRVSGLSRDGVERRSTLPAGSGDEDGADDEDTGTPPRGGRSRRLGSSSGGRQAGRKRAALAHEDVASWSPVERRRRRDADDDAISTRSGSFGERDDGDSIEDGEVTSPLDDVALATAAAVPAHARSQPGESTSMFRMSAGAGVSGSGVSARGGGAGGSEGLAALGWLLGLFRDFVQDGARLAGGASGPSRAWLGPTMMGLSGAAGETSAVGATAVVPSGGVPLAPTVATVSAEASATSTPGNDGLRLDDRAKGEVYVCFEGPLGAHLKSEVREKIWKGEYVEIFSLLPLEKFHLDKIKPDESKKEEEEKRRYRLIPRTFSNWLQAFAILASVIGEKEPEHCSALFCYMDAIGEAYRTYGGQGWLRYDEQFRQRKGVWTGIRWDHKDIALWMRLMTAPAVQPFRGGAGGQGAAGSSAAHKKGYCWQFNDGQCKFGASCRFKHECSGCGGTHSYAKCFKKGKGKTGDSGAKGDDAGEGRSDAAVPK